MIKNIADYSTFPQQRLRRLRAYPWLRELVAEHRVTANDLIWPIFVRHESQDPCIPSLPGVQRYSLNEITEAAKKARDVGIRALMLFPVNSQDTKTPDGKEALNPNNILNQALQIISQNVPDIGLFADVALDPYTTHGHDGILKDNKILNDETLEILAEQALLLAKSGAHGVTPSDMMDGNVSTIRKKLDENSFQDTLIMSYPVKFASSFYKPFREAVDAGKLQGLGDKKTYQIDPRNRTEAYKEVWADINDGADLVIIKPGLPYLDILKTVCDNSSKPVLAYQVSGEYSLLQNCPDMLFESLIAFKRAGATGIISYGAFDIAQTIKEGNF